MRIAVFASGGGSNFQAILDAVHDGTLVAEVVLLISNRVSCGAVARAKEHGVPSAIVDPAHMDEETVARTTLAVLDAHRADFIALAGYLKKIPDGVVARYRGRMTNIHPALLPAFGGKGMYGRHVHEAVIESGVRWTGVTIHLVDSEYDTGPIVVQEPVAVLAHETAASLATRVLEVEHRLYPQALRLFAEGLVTVDGKRVAISESRRSDQKN